MDRLSVVIKLLSASCLVVLVGCEPRRGSIPASAGGENVYIQYEQDIFAHDGRLTVTAPDGEIFTGKFVQQSTATTGSEWEFGDDDDDEFTTKDSTTVSSKAEAILIGNRGSSMECKLQLSQPECGIDCGAVGKCKSSTGEPISIAF